jgi:glutamine synthetase
VLRNVAQRNGLVCLLHEKPFAGINGSGKHNNWSISYGSRNLLNPGCDPHQNAIFLTTLCAIIEAVDKHADLLRASVSGAGNDHRLGANEAPPAIISIFLGEQLSDIYHQLEKGTARTSKKGGNIQIGVNMLPQLPRDAGDRNRTSPFAFTGNKFEFRAVGSSQSIAGPNTVLNTIVAESLDYIATRLEKMINGKVDLVKALQKLLPELIKEFKPVLFEGDNYSQEWHDEAARRGLPNYKTSVEAIQLATSKESLELFTKYKVYSRRELHSRRDILLENYVKTINIEAQTATVIAGSMIMPAAIRYQKDVADAINSARAVGVESDEQAAMLTELVDTISAFRGALTTLDHAISGQPHGDVVAHAKYQRDSLLTAMADLRVWADKLELMVADQYWPLPTYREMLFIR